MNILIIGGSGSIGLDLIKFFLDQYPSFRISATCGNPVHMKSLQPSINWISYIHELCVNVKPVYPEIFDFIYIVSGSHTLRSQASCNLVKNHSLPLLSFVESIVSSYSTQPVFVFVSSANGIRSLDFNTSLVPQTPNLYGLEKLALELLLLALFEYSGCNSYIVRLNNVFDPAISKSGFGVFNHFARTISKGLPPLFTGDCELPKDYIYIRDLTHFLSSLILPDLSRPSVFELYGGQSITACDLYDSMYFYFNKGVHLSPSRVSTTHRDPMAIKVSSAMYDIEGMIAKSFESII
jgi:hypothetical protein